MSDYRMQNAVVPLPDSASEQMLQLFAIACEKPEKYGRPISHWTPRELADEVIKQGIVSMISPRHVGRLMEEADFVTAPVAVLVKSPPDPQFEEKVKDICECYLGALELAERGERTVCMDEMTGIQALERKYPDQPMRPGQRERKEFEYLRHGTQTGKCQFRCRLWRGDSRERWRDSHALQTIWSMSNRPLPLTQRANKWHLVMDCLNTHQSESLVRYVAEVEGLDLDLGFHWRIGDSRSPCKPALPS